MWHTVDNGICRWSLQTWLTDVKLSMFVDSTVLLTSQGYPFLRDFQMCSVSTNSPLFALLYSDAYFYLPPTLSHPQIPLEYTHTGVLITFTQEI